MNKIYNKILLNINKIKEYSLIPHDIFTRIRDEDVKVSKDIVIKDNCLLVSDQFIKLYYQQFKNYLIKNKGNTNIILFILIIIRGDNPTYSNRRLKLFSNITNRLAIYKEIKLLNICLLSYKNAFNLWHYRKLLINKIMSNNNFTYFLKHELSFLKLFFKRYPKNYFLITHIIYIINYIFHNNSNTNNKIFLIIKIKNIFLKSIYAPNYSILHLNYITIKLIIKLNTLNKDKYIADELKQLNKLESFFVTYNINYDKNTFKNYLSLVKNI